MSTMTKELREIAAQDPELNAVLDAFASLNDIYEGSLRAMGLLPETTPVMKRTDQVMLSGANNSNRLKISI